MCIRDSTCSILKGLIGGGEFFRILFVIMYVKNIRNHMEIAAGINTGPCGVILLGDLPGEGKQTVNLLSSFIIPGFIKRAPAYDLSLIHI